MPLMRPRLPPRASRRSRWSPVTPSISWAPLRDVLSCTASWYPLRSHLMNTALRATVLLAGLFASAELIAAQTPGCPGVKFSESVLEKFPKVQEACLDVITKAGQDYA